LQAWPFTSVALEKAKLLVEKEVFSEIILSDLVSDTTLTSLKSISGLIKHSVKAMTFAELKEMAKAVGRKKQVLRSWLDLFNQLDPDKNGSLDRDEIEKYLPSKGDFSPLQLTAFLNHFDECDQDGDGGLSFEEFALAMSKYTDEEEREVEKLKEKEKEKEKEKAKKEKEKKKEPDKRRDK